MTSNHDYEPLPLDDESQNEKSPDSSLRALAAQTHPRREFTARLRAEMAQQAIQPRRRLGFAWARPWIAQAALVMLLVGLVAVAFRLTPGLLPLHTRQGQPETTTPLPDGSLPALPQDLPSGALVRLGRGSITSLDTAQDGRYAVGSTAGVCIYNTGLMPDWCVRINGGAVRVSFNLSGDRLAVAVPGGMEGSSLQVLDAANGQLLAERFFQTSWAWYMPDYAAFAWDPSGAPRLAAAEEGGQVSVWDWQNDAIVWGPAAQPDEVRALDWSQGTNGESILATGGTYGLVLLDGLTGQEMKKFEPTWQAAPVLGVSALDLSADGSWLAYTHPEGVVALHLEGWNAGDIIRWTTEGMPSGLTWDRGPEGRPERLAAWMNNAVLIYTLGQDQPDVFTARAPTPLAWETGGGLLYVRADDLLGNYENGEESIIPGEYSTPPANLAWKAPGEILSASGGAINGWDIASGKLGWVSEIRLGTYPWLISLTPDGARAAYLIQGEELVIWDTASNQQIARFNSGHQPSMPDGLYASFSADGARLVTAARDGKLIVWNADSGWLVRELTVLNNPVQLDAMALSPDGITAALAWLREGQSGIDLWDVERGEKTASIPLRETVNALVWSPDGRQIAAASGYSARVIDAASGQMLHNLGPEIDPATFGTEQFDPGTFASLAFSPDGRYLATGGNLVTLWDLNDRSIAQTFTGLGATAYSLAFDPAGTRLASGLRDGTILVWDLGGGPLPVIDSPTPTPISIDPTPTPQEQGTVTGRIVAGYGDQSPLAGLKIQTEESTRGTEPVFVASTDADGRFTIPDLSPGKHSFVTTLLGFEVEIPASGAAFDLGVLKYPLNHAPYFYWHSPKPVALETLLDESTVVDHILLYGDTTWTRPTEAEQQEQVWSWALRDPAVAARTGEQGLREWFQKPSVLFDTRAVLQQSPPGGPDLTQPGEDMRHLLGLWNRSAFLTDEAYNSQALDDLFNRRFVEVWLLGYALDGTPGQGSIRQMLDGEDGVHYTLLVHPEPGFQVIRFPGNGGVMQVHVVSDGEEIARLLPDIPEKGEVSSIPEPAPDEVDLSLYDVSYMSSKSANNAWSLEMLRGEVTENSPSQHDYNRLTVKGPDDQEWVVEEWTDHEMDGMGESRPTRFLWWPLAPKSLYWYETGVTAGCAWPFNTNLRRLDLATGTIEVVEPFGPDYIGPLEISSDSPEVAAVDGTNLRIHNLETGAVTDLPFEPLNAGGWGVVSVMFQPENNGIVVTMQRPLALCGEETFSQEVVWFDRAQNRTLKQAIPQGMRVNGWEVDGHILMRDTAIEEQYRMNIITGEIEPVIPLPVDQAHKALFDYLSILARGPLDPSQGSRAYLPAVDLYAGPWDALARQNPGVDPEDRAELLRLACEENGYVCLPVKTSTMIQERDGFRFQVQYRQRDGRDFSLGSQTRFEFWVKAGPDGKYRVMNLPPVQQ